MLVFILYYYGFFQPGQWTPRSRVSTNNISNYILAISGIAVRTLCDNVVTTLGRLTSNQQLVVFGRDKAVTNLPVVIEGQFDSQPEPNAVH